MKDAKQLFLIICFFGAAIGLIWRTFARPMPTKSELMSIEGVVRDVTIGTRKSRYDIAHYPVIHIEGRNDAYSYLDWFPDPERIYREIHAGDRVRFLSDTPNGSRWIWQLEKEGRQVIAYDEVFAAVSSNRGTYPY